MILRNQDAVNGWVWGPYFKPDEFRCSHCHELLIDTDLMDKLLKVRLNYGRGMIINSGYRCSAHNIAVSHTGPHGPHTKGAVDVHALGVDAVKILKIGMNEGMTGIGVNMKGNLAQRFIHFDVFPSTLEIPRPALWSY